ncbi:MAG: hypothetical protein AAGG48_11860 [Planctomycetota bacterium]
MPEDNTAKYLDEVKKGKPRRFVMICKGIKILSLIAYKKGTVETYKKLAKTNGNGQFFHGVIDGKGENISFKLARSDGYEKPPGKELTLKDHLKSEFGMKFRPEYKIVDELPDVPEDDDSASDENDAERVFDTSDYQAKLDSLASGIKAFATQFPDRRVEILKPTKAVKDFLSAPSEAMQAVAKQALTKIERLVGEATGKADVSHEAVSATDVVGRLKTLGAAIKKACVEKPVQKNELLGLVKIVKDFIAAPSQEGKLTAEEALDKISVLLAGTRSSGDGVANPDKKKWTAAAKKIAPMLKSALAEGQGDTGKMRAFFAFAREKAEAGDYQPALKTLAKLKKLIDEASVVQDSPRAQWESATKHASFQIRRLQTGLELFSKEMENAASKINPKYVAVVKHAFSSSIAISRKLDGVIEQLQQIPTTQAEIDAMTTYLESDTVKSAEGPNPFGQDVNIVESLRSAARVLKTEITSSV